MHIRDTNNHFCTCKNNYFSIIYSWYFLSILLFVLFYKTFIFTIFQLFSYFSIFWVYPLFCPQFAYSTYVIFTFLQTILWFIFPNIIYHFSYNEASFSRIILLTFPISALPFKIGVKCPINFPISDTAVGWISANALSISIRISFSLNCSGI